MQLDKTDAGEIVRFTSQELKVVRRAVRGLQHKEIAADLELSPHTVRDHLQRVRLTLGLHNIAEICHWCHLQPAALEGEWVQRVPAVLNDQAA